jgi:hypothetical protein
VANVEAVSFYEISDEPSKAIPENRFGLYYDTGLQKPKISLLMATAFAGGVLSTAEKSLLSQRNFTYYNTITGLSYNKIDDGTSINIFPNPVKDILKIHCSVYINSVQIYNSLGNMILSHSSDKQSNSLNLNFSSIPAGIYMIVVSNEQSRIVKMIIK